MKKVIKKALKIAGIGVGCAVVGIVGIYAWVGVGMSMNEFCGEDPDNAARRVVDVTKVGYKLLWEKASK